MRDGLPTLIRYVIGPMDLACGMAHPWRFQFATAPQREGASQRFLRPIQLPVDMPKGIPPSRLGIVRIPLLLGKLPSRQLRYFGRGELSWRTGTEQRVLAVWFLSLGSQATRAFLRGELVALEVTMMERSDAQVRVRS